MGVYLELLNDETLALKASYRDRERVKAVGEGKWSAETKRWLFPLSHSVVDNIQREFGKIAIEPQIFTRLSLLDSFQRKVQKIKKLKDCNVDESFLKVTLWPHQRVGVRFCQEFDKCCCFDDMGLGKSLVAVYMGIWRKSRGEIKKCIILAPKSCKESVWGRQIEKFTDEKCLVVDGTLAKRRQLYKRYKREDILFLIFSYETFRTDFLRLKEMGILNSGNDGAGMLILDEVQKVKNPQAQISKVVKNVQALFALALTGTPVYNRPEDIWGPMNIVSPGLLGSNYQRFTDRYLIKGSYGNDQVAGGYRNLKELKGKIESVSIRRMKEEAIDLPEKTYEDLFCEMVDPKQREAYESMRKELFAWIRDMDDKEVRVRANQLLTRNVRLSQLSDGFISSPELKKPKWFRSSKVEEIDGILEDYADADSGIVIFCRWVPLVHFLFGRYREKYGAVHLMGQTKDKDRLKAIDAFQEGKAKVFVLQIQSGSLGIDLSRAKIGIFIDKAFLSPGILRQSEDRLHRLGQKENCTMISLITPGTIDERWDKLMQAKLELSNKIIPSMPRLNKEDWLYLTGKEGSAKK